MYETSNILTTFLPLCCGGLLFLGGAGTLTYALIQRKKATDTGLPVQNLNTLIIIGAVLFVLSLCACSLSVIIPLIQNMG